MNTILDSLVEVKLAEEDDFLKVKETLTRIGVSSKKEQKLFQSCLIFHKQGKYYIVHFKEMFAIDGKTSNMNDEDLGRRNTIIKLLQEWNLIKVVEPEKITKPILPLSMIKIIPHKEKSNWTLVQKYTIGKPKQKYNNDIKTKA